RAIVTDIEGTTRDIITESFDINGINATLTDTAGIREDNKIDTVEKIGINKAKETIEDSDNVQLLLEATIVITTEDEEINKIAKNKAKETIVDSDIILLLFDGTIGITKEDEEIFELAKNKKTILISTKQDINEKTYEGALPISSKTGKNIEELKELIYKNVVD